MFSQTLTPILHSPDAAAPPSDRKRERRPFDDAMLRAEAATNPVRGEMSPGWIQFNVGGKFFITHESTIRNASPGFLLRRGLAANWAGFLRDREGNIFLDRDPDLFDHVLSYLRGYDMNLAGRDKLRIAMEAEALELPELARLLQADSGARLAEHRYKRFAPTTGGGLRENGTVLQAGWFSTLIDPALRPGLHHIVIAAKTHFTSSSQTQRGVVHLGVVHCPDDGRVEGDGARSYRGLPFSAFFSSEGSVDVNPTALDGEMDLTWHRIWHRRLQSSMTEAAALAPSLHLSNRDRVCISVHVAEDSRSATVTFERLAAGFNFGPIGPIELSVRRASDPPLKLHFAVSCHGPSDLKIVEARTSCNGEAEDALSTESTPHREAAVARSVVAGDI